MREKKLFLNKVSITQIWLHSRNQPESSTSKEIVFSVPVLVENAADQQMDRSWINSCKKVVAGIEVIVKGGRNRLEESIVQLFDGWL